MCIYYYYYYYIELFYFIAKALDYCPDTLLKLPILNPLIQVATIGLQLKHKDSQKAILSFFEHLFEVAQRSNTQIFTVCGPSVTHTLIHSLAGLK